MPEEPPTTNPDGPAELADQTSRESADQTSRELADQTSRESADQTSPASADPTTGESAHQTLPASADPTTAELADQTPPELADETIRAGEEMARLRFTRRRLLGFGLFVVSSLAFLYFVLPKVVGLQHTWNRLQQGDGWWLGIAAVVELGVFASYVSLFRTVFVRGETKIDWRESWQINLAGLAATRLFAAGGAGGIALTAWALRRSGLEARVVACRMIAFLVVLYGVYMVTLVLDGLGLYTGLLPGRAPFAVTVVPAIFGALVIAIFLAGSLLPRDFERLVGRWTAGGGRLGRIAARAAAAPATAAMGVRTAISLVRSRSPYLLAAVTYWGCDIAVLTACFHAFGTVPPQAVIVMCYFVGMLGNTLPLPGGIGGVDGGMIGAFTAFGVPVELSIVSVLAYRAFAFWLPTLPGAVAYLQLRRTVHRWDAAGAPSYT